jgi:hypothetical protein
MTSTGCSKMRQQREDEVAKCKQFPEMENKLTSKFPKILKLRDSLKSKVQTSFSGVNKGSSRIKAVP